MNHASLQGLAAFIAITFGLIPLGQLALTGRVGSVWGFLLDGTGALPWLGPALVALAGVIAVAVLEQRRRRAGT